MLDYARKDDEQIKTAINFDSARLLEEIYLWHPGSEDVWGCFKGSGVATKMRDLFVDGFAPRLSPEQRSMGHFRKAVNDLGKVLEDEAASSWSDTIQTVSVGRKEPVNLRGNASLSLWHHMKWISQTFGHLPGASVMIR
ncbi:hypothetical protein [Planctomyces sp. SH-PL62]|uniref:hypothetical protein n=1 Tax=Planctomyces sp. SH-PL62 TaxID=1636152 RepID=UPI0012E85845|nr:hypothetical protein [Planctomyces sp. SH-PL62]